MASATTDRRQGLTGDKGFKAPVQAATTANIVLSGEQTIDGVAVKAIGINGYPDRVLVWNQTNPVDNGIWDVSTASWTRSQDSNGTQDLVTGTMGLVTGGTLYANQQWILITTGIISPGSTSIVFKVGIPSLPILAATTGAGLVGFSQAVTYPLGTLGARGRQSVSIKDAPYNALGDGTDATANIQAALNSLISTPGGGIVIAPPGTYRLTSKLVIPSNVLFLGPQMLIDPSNLAGATQGAVLLIDWGATQDNHAVEMSHSSGIEGFTFYYPGQVAKTAATPIAYGFSISTPTAAGIYDNIYIRNINLYNSYKGIRLNNGGRWLVQNIQGDPLFLGFTADQCVDVCRMENIHFFNFYTQGSALETWVSNNCTSFEFRRIDQLFASKLFSWNRNIAYYCRDNIWATFSEILCDKARYPFIEENAAQILVNGFVLIGNAEARPGIWLKSGGPVTFVNGHITSTCSIGCQVGTGMATTAVKFSNTTFDNQHTALLDLSNTADIRLDNCSYAVPPFGGYNVRINGERLPASDTSIATGTITATNATVITGGFQFDLNVVNTKTLTFDTTNLSESNGLYVLEFDYLLSATFSSTWYFQFLVQTDTGANSQVVFSPQFPLIVNDPGGSASHIRIPFFINHGRFKQIAVLRTIVTVGIPGATLNITNIALFEQANIKTTDAQVSNMMRQGYNLDAYNMGQTLFSKGKNRKVITQSEAGIGRTTEIPIAGTWAVGDEVYVFSPVASGFIGYVCTTAGTPGTWKSFGAISA